MFSGLGRLTHWFCWYAQCLLITSREARAMSFERPDIDGIQITGVDDPEWYKTLLHETVELDHTGVSAAVLSLRLRGSKDRDRRAKQLQNLLRRLLRPTDRVGKPSSGAFSILLVPLQSIADTSAQVHALTNALDNAGLDVAAGFALRRTTESLVDTWARAEAEADRAAFRATNGGGLVLSE